MPQEFVIIFDYYGVDYKHYDSKEAAMAYLQ